MPGVQIVADCSAIIFYLTDDGSDGQQVRDRLRWEDSLAAPWLLDYEVIVRAGRALPRQAERRAQAR